MLILSRIYLTAFLVDAIETLGVGKTYADCSFPVGAILEYPNQEAMPEHLRGPNGIMQRGMYLGRQEYHGVFYYVIAVMDPLTPKGRKTPILELHAYETPPDVNTHWRYAATIMVAERSKMPFNASEVLNHPKTPSLEENAANRILDGSTRPKFNAPPREISASPLNPLVEVKNKPFLEH